MRYVQPHKSRAGQDGAMHKRKDLPGGLHLARLASMATSDPLLRAETYDAWCRFKHEKQKNPRDAVAAEDYYRSLFRDQERAKRG
jgi:hypothetical protein